MDSIEFERLWKSLEELLGFDLSAYKQQQMRRRVASFLDRHGTRDVDECLARLRAEPELLESLKDMLTINVTEFFRDGSQWQRLQREVLPALLAERRTVRTWSAGCSHGQEPLSLAMTFDRLGALDRCRILATDIDRAALARARAGGPYTEMEMSNVSARDRAQYFERGETGYVARAWLRQPARYRELNLLRDDFEREFDLIVCRNVMIYFDEPTKNALVARFASALRAGGVLFIGATESLLGTDLEGLERLGGSFYRRGVRAARAVA